ncbi:MAG: FHA domain-containing protein [Polyangiales bacterium]
MARRGDEPQLQYWLDTGDGRVPIRTGALLIGRSPDCEIVIPDARVSRHQLLVRATEGGVELVLLGRATVTVDGAPVSSHATLASGALISLCGRQFRVVTTPLAPDAAPVVEWALEMRDAPLHRVSRSPYTVGGGADDDLHLPGWPPALLCFRVVQRALVLEVSQPDVHCGSPLQEGEIVTLRAGMKVKYRDRSLRVLPVPREADALTTPEAGEELPRRVLLEFLPRGGRVTVGYGGWARTVWLADRRCDLIATLLAPPAPYLPGDAVPDDLLLPRIWPGGTQGRVELNTLVFRTRKDLVRADLDGGTLLHRAEGTVRFCLTEGAEVVVRAA